MVYEEAFKALTRRVIKLANRENWGVNLIDIYAVLLWPLELDRTRYREQAKTITRAVEEAIALNSAQPGDRKEVLRQLLRMNEEDERNSMVRSVSTSWEYQQYLESLDLVLLQNLSDVACDFLEQVQDMGKLIKIIDEVGI